MYKLMRANLRQLRQTHSPRNAVEKRLMDLFRISIQKFGEQLLTRPAKINAELMNQLSKNVVDAFTNYMLAYSDTEGGYRA